MTAITTQQYHDLASQIAAALRASQTSGCVVRTADGGYALASDPQGLPHVRLNQSFVGGIEIELEDQDGSKLSDSEALDEAWALLYELERRTGGNEIDAIVTERSNAKLARMATETVYHVQADAENPADAWWTTLREQYPAFARSFDDDGSGYVTRDVLDQLAAIPGYSDGPDYARDALIVEERIRWASDDSVVRKLS